MSDPKRLLDLEDDPILRAGLDDGAPPGVEDRMLAGLGLATVAAAATTTTTAAATTTTKAIAKLGLAKWLAVSAVVATAATGGVLATRAPEAPVPAASAMPSASIAKQDLARTVAPPPPTVAPPEPEPVVVPPPPPPAPRPVVVAPSAPSVAAPSTLSDELALLAEANAAVQRRDSAAATSALDRYDTKYAHGSLSVEAEALRIETLALTDEPRARAMAKAFLVRHPSNPASRGVRRIAEGVQ